MTTTPDTTIDTTIDATVTATLAELQVELDALGSAGDCSSYNQLAAYEARQSSIMGAMRTLRESRTILAEITPQLHALEKWHGHLLGWRALLITQLEATAPTDPRAYGIQLSIRRINVGLDLINEAHPGRMVLDDLDGERGLCALVACGACPR